MGILQIFPAIMIETGQFRNGTNPDLLTHLPKKCILNGMQQPSLFKPISLTVSEITQYLRQLFESDEILRDVWVQGEISNLSRPVSGHIYFTLKDASAALRCVIWKSQALRLRVALQNGLAMEAHGSISLYEKDGAYQLYIDALRPAGEGRLLQEYLRLKARLEAEGLFAQERKRPIPSRPKVIGIVTSATGAALQDMLNTLAHRYPLAEVVLAPSAVQGDNAPFEIAAALAALNQHVHPDVILLARGGGSLEDLWAFNDERVVRAIVASQAPVISGVGHETDFSLADFAADLRAPTPTAAAVLATPDQADLRASVEALTARLTYSGESFVQGFQARLEDLHRRLQRASPLWQIQNDRQRLDGLAERGQRALVHLLQLQRAHARGINQRLTALNPLAVLQRGFSVVSRPDGSLVTRVDQVKTGDSIQVRVVDGKFIAEVT
jgi:exodeoxyribonuclease VII large subunit